MSLLNDASLVMIPSGYKDTKLYSVKPTNGDGDFTFSRGSNLAATRVNSEGLIEKGRENLFFASDTSDSTAGRSIRGSSTTIKGVSGFLYSDDAGNPNINKSVAGYSTGFATFSIYVDTTNANTIQLNFAIDGSAINGTQAKFNATTKTWHSLIENTSYVSSGSTQLSFEDLGDNVFRLSIGANFTPSGSTYLPVVYFGTGNTNVAIGGAQVERSLVATDYIETTTTTEQAGILEDMPRLDYSGGASCPSLLLEPQRSNLITQSEYGGDYLYVNTSYVQNTQVSPEGVINSITIESDTTNSSHYFGSNFNFFTSGTTYTSSVFIKKGTGRYFQLTYGFSSFGTDQYANYDLQDGVVTYEGSLATASIEDFGNGWYRCVLTATATSNFNDRFYAVFITSGTASRVPSHSSSLNYYFYGFQMEEGSYATSYIPTYGASVTRSQDICTLTNIADIINSSEGVLYAKISALSDDLTNRAISLSDGTLNNGIHIEYFNVSNRIRFRVYAGGVLRATIQAIGITITNTNKLALKWESGFMTVYVNGTLVQTQPIAATPTGLDRLNFDLGQGSSKFIGKANQIQVYPTALTNDQLASLTTI